MIKLLLNSEIFLILLVKLLNLDFKGQVMILDGKHLRSRISFLFFKFSLQSIIRKQSILQLLSLRFQQLLQLKYLVLVNLILLHLLSFTLLHQRLLLPDFLHKVLLYLVELLIMMFFLKLELLVKFLELQSNLMVILDQSIIPLLNVLVPVL